MRITRRTSGGRGEYEISESSPEGITPNQLVKRRIFLQLGTWRIDSGTWLSSQGKKYRLRRFVQAKSSMQVPRQVAAALLMPALVREDKALGPGAPVIQTGRYAIEHIHVASAQIIDPDMAELQLESMTLRNAMTEAEELGVSHRVNQVSQIWTRASEFPKVISDLLDQHRIAVTSGNPISANIERLVGDLQAQVSENSTDIGLVYSQQRDVVPALLESLNLTIEEPTITVDEIDPEEVDLRARNVKEWKRWANARGPKSAVFRQKVRKAYRSTCVVCGSRFPRTSSSAAGVDAAHILPWSKYDLDDVQNGICLCKIHHWAFDEGLLTIRYDGKDYIIEMPLDVEQELLKNDASYTVAMVKQFVGKIATDRLPALKAEWPKPQFLAELNSA